MSFNSWDKLAKAQRDYPKLKFAVPFVDKALKKNPNNPYLLSWRADLALQQNADPITTASILAKISTTVPEVDLLPYLYTVFIEASRRGTLDGLSQSTIGSQALKCWQSAAKKMQRKRERMELWESLFNTAVQEDMWEDARFAVVNYNKEGPLDKKNVHYTLILATQLAAEQKAADPGAKDPLSERMTQVQFDIALKNFKQSFEAAPDDALSMKSIRDLRFMADIFKRQDRSNELQRLWENPSQPLKALFLRHQDDLVTLMTRILREQEDWLQLENHCTATITHTLKELDLANGSKSEFWELCAWRGDTWSALLDALQAIRPGDEGKKVVSDLIEKCFGGELKAQDRPLRLTYMKLRQFIGESMLHDCKDYFARNSRLPSCFKDIRPFIQSFSVEESIAFVEFVMVETRKPRDNLNEAEYNDWRQTDLNALKFMYLFWVSRPENPERAPLEALFNNSTMLLQMWPDNAELGCVAIYTLLNIHHRFICKDESKNPLEVTANSRVLLQATMLARHLVEKDDKKNNRTLALLAARLHLNLGLGTIAFRFYNHVKCKEMLLDTLSPYMLSRISMTHPNKVSGYGGFSADEELSRVVGTIDRMEKKANSFLLNDIPDFIWDQAIDVIALKRKLRSSLTKHICTIERNRIARLTGESVKDLPLLPFRAYKDISDNVDRTVFPNYEHLPSSERVLNMIMPNPVPNVHWLAETYFDRERCTRLLYGEAQTVLDWDAYQTLFKDKKHEVYSEKSNRIRVEDRLQIVWNRLSGLVIQLHAPTPTLIDMSENFRQLLNNLKMLRTGMEKLRMPGSTTLKLEDEPTMFHENMLQACYSLLEVCRALVKLADLLRDSVIKIDKAKGPHPIRAQVPKDYDTELLQETKVCFQAVRDVAQSYIELIRKRGIRAIVAQVRWGITGESLKGFLSDDDVEYYAKEYVESAVEAWNGVLKIKLK